jgi:hypothetical protein
MVRRANPHRLAELYGSWRGGARAELMEGPPFEKALADAGLSREDWTFTPW